MKIPQTILKHPGVARVVAGEDEGCDEKYYVFFKEGWGYYEHGQREAYWWISGSKAIDSVKQFKELGLEKK